MKKAPLFYHERYVDYNFGRFHPFDSKRFPQFVKLVSENEEMSSAICVKDSPRADDEELMLVHSKHYIKKVENLSERDGRLSPDTPVLKGTPEAARRIVGGSLAAARAVEDDDTLINLGGLHHAGRESGEGFCLFNDVAVAAEFLVEEDKKVCIFDTDAHQGNGTMDIFWTSPEVLFISIHQHPMTLYPGRGFVHEIGGEEGKGYTVNIPMPRDANIAEYYYTLEEVVKPIVNQFNPDVLIRNGGSDPHHSDSLTDLALDMRGLEYLGRTARELSRDNDSTHIDLMLSGYGLRVIEGWQAIMKGALDMDIKTPTDQRIGEPGQEPKRRLLEEVKDLKDILNSYWDI